MHATLHHFAPAEDEDDFRVSDGGEPVCYGDGCEALLRMLQGLLHHFLALRVKDDARIWTNCWQQCSTVCSTLRWEFPTTVHASHSPPLGLCWRQRWHQSPWWWRACVLWWWMCGPAAHAPGPPAPPSRSLYPGPRWPRPASGWPGSCTVTFVKNYWLTDPQVQAKTITKCTVLSFLKHFGQ